MTKKTKKPPIVPIGDSEVLSVIRHEMQSPLTVLGGMLHMLQSADGEEKENLLRIATRSYKSLLYQLKTMEDYLRLGHHQGLPLNISEQDIRSMVDFDIDMVKEDAGERGMEIVNDVKSYRICLDSDKTDQVIVNLLNNATKYGYDGSKIVICSEEVEKPYKADEEPRKYLRVSVLNEGEPVLENFRAKLFQKFTQGNNSNTENGSDKKSFGLGLYICDRIVKRHGGRMHYHFHEKDGLNEFNFTIPTDLKPGYKK